MPYAEGTTVSVTSSILEMERLVSKYGATGFGYGTDAEAGMTRVLFRIHGRMIKFEMKQPPVAKFSTTPTGRSRDRATASKAAADEEKRRWRALTLVVKSLLVAVDEGVLSLDQAFLPHIMLPNGATVGQWTAPQLDKAYSENQMPGLLPGSVPQLEGS